ncbi:hypothetical protein [Kitasatospora sp. NPDC051914]
MRRTGEDGSQDAFGLQVGGLGAVEDHEAVGEKGGESVVDE